MRSKTKVPMFLIAPALLISFLCACTAMPGESAPVGQNEAIFPLEVTDQLGRQVRIEKAPERIVSLAPGNTEIVYALGLEEKLVGVTEYCDYPEAAKDKPKIGGFSTVDIEKVVESQPDLILAANIHEDEVIPRLEGLDLTVLALQPKTLDEMLDAIALVGTCAGEQEEADQLVAGMEGRIRAITDRTDSLAESERPRVFYITWHDPLKTSGSGTLHDELIVKTGGTNIARELTGYPAISLEAVIQANPEVMITGVGMGSGEDLPFQFAKTEPRLRNTDARINNKVYKIDLDLCGRPGPRIVDGLEKLAEFIHPELFGGANE